MLSSSSSVFDNLPQRPPTPPRDVSKAVDDAIAFLDDSNEVSNALKKPQEARRTYIRSPQHSAPSSQESRTGSNASKKVGFTPVPTYHSIAPVGQISSPSRQLEKSAPASKHARPLKSILKQANLPPPLTPDDLDTKLSYFSPQIPGSFAKMLQSVIQQLAGQSLSGRLDAYLALNGALKAYEGVPDVQAMASRMGLLMQFLTRDMVWKSDATGALDTNIITQALKLTATILYDARLSAALDDDFRIFLVDRSITVIELANMPKAVVKPHMFLLAQQRFRASVMTSARADRIITALATIEERCSGNNVVATKFVIYQRLLEQTPKLMLQRMRDWFEHIVHGMLSDVKDTRIRAIEACNQAGAALGQQSSASKSVLDLFQSEVEEGHSFCEYLTLRLTQMVSDKETGAYVPQIWAAIVLFFRNKRYPLEQWPNFKQWLRLIQKCLNSSVLTVRYHAHLAWNKLAFAVMPDASTSRNMLDILKVPAKSGMNIRKTEPNAKQIGKFALESYYNVLHYALRPGLSHEELDAAWDAVVEPILSDMIDNKTNKGKWMACGIIHGLCTPNTGIWNLNAAFEATPIKPEELPRLDPKWLRTRLARLLKLLSPVFEATMTDTSDLSTAVDATWRALMQSVAEAGTQEIKTSNDLKEAVALLVGLWRKLWSDSFQLPAEADAGPFAERLGSLIATSALSIGAGPFGEEIIAKTKDDVIQAALTPSHRSSKHHSAPHSPLLFLFGLLYNPAPQVVASGKLPSLANELLRLQNASRPSTAARIETLAKSLRLWTSKHLLDWNKAVSACLWVCVSAVAIQLLETLAASPESGDSQTLGHTLQQSSSILAIGIEHASSSVEACDAVLDLHGAMLSAARLEAGVGGTVVAVVEPFSKALLGSASHLTIDVRLRLSAHAIQTAVWPRSRQEMEQARKQLWGVGVAPHKVATAFDPFEHLYVLTADTLSSIYSSLESLEDDVAEKSLEFVGAVIRFLEDCPVSLLAIALRKLQQGFVAWVIDASRKTSEDVLASAVLSTWHKLLELMQSLPQKDSTVLTALEPLLVSGFSSPHRKVVNATIEFWNRTFGQQDGLVYPANLKDVLLARASETELALPDFPESAPNATLASLPAFFESQVEAESGLKTASSSSPDPIAAASLIPVTAPTSVKSDSGKKRRKKSKLPQAKLRHDDSQIQFAPIDSSPVERTEDSQLLTEHQKEAKLRQVEAAKMFPDMSSSPAVESRAVKVQKRLDFNSKNVAGAGTPVQLAEEGPMSDDIPSSPTPSSTRDAEAAQIEMLHGDTTDDELAQDPPSSPPRGADDGPNHIQAESEAVDDIAEGEAQIKRRSPVKARHETNVPHRRSSAPNDGSPITSKPARRSSPAAAHNSDLASDSVLPDEQLQLEAQQAADVEKAEAAGNTAVSTTFYGDAEPQEDGTHNTTQFQPASDVSEQAEEGASRVEDSFVEPAEQQESASKSGHSSKRKRKRSSDSVKSAKKRKSQSPLKSIQGFFSSFLSNQRPEDDEDMEDEIVVASSQPSLSPEKARRQPSPVVAIPVRSIEEPSTSQPEATSQAPQKRGRGRPRKSETPSEAASQVGTSQKRALKRRASAISEGSEPESASTSFVKDTPAVHKARKQREGPDTKLVKAAQLSQDESEVGRSTRRTTAATSQGDEDGDVGEEDVAEDEVVAASRPIATPKSIIGRLRDVLADLPKILLGTQEERELDDVLFEIRREVHDAGRRGRT